MDENTEREDSLNGRRERLLQKVEKQIRRIEDIIEELLDGVDMSELSSKERLLVAARFTNLHQRAVLLSASLERNTAESAENTALSVIVSDMRGVFEKEQLRIIDAKVTVYPEIEDNRQDD